MWLREWRSVLPKNAVWLLLAFLCACGGGGSSGVGPPPPPPPPAPGFSLVLESQTVTIQQQGTSVFQTFQVSPTNGFSGTVTLTISGLPAGVTVTPPGPYSLTITNNAFQSIAIQLFASTAAAVGNSTVTVTGTSGALSHADVFSLDVTAVAPFSIQATPNVVSLTPASTVTVQVTVQASPGTSPQLSTSLSDLPPNSGVNIAVPQGFLTPSSPVSFTVEAGALAQALQSFPIVVTATDGVNTSVAVVPLTVTVRLSNAAATRSTYATTFNNPQALVYDSRRKLLFVAVETLNEVVVLSSVDGHQVATIPAEFPATIDESADGTAVFVGSSFSPYVTTIDPNSFQVLQQVVIPQLGQAVTSTEPSSALQLVALSNEDVLIQVSNSVPLGSHLYLWTPPTTTFVQLDGQSSAFITQVMQRSADHSKVLLSNGSSAGSTALVYDVGTGTIAGPANLPGLPLAISPDGSQIAAEGIQATPTTFYDSQFNLIGSLSLEAFPADGIIYSLDGRFVYAFGVFTGQDSPSVDAVAVIDAQKFSLVGLVPDFQLNGGNASTPFAIDETGMVFAGNGFPGNAQGVEFLDVSSPGSFSLPTPGPFIVQPELVSLSSTTLAQLNGSGFLSTFAHQVFFGAPPASPQTLLGSGVSVQSPTLLNVSVPQGVVSGPANATLVRSDGFFEVIPDAVSYGPTIVLVTPNTGSPQRGRCREDFWLRLGFADPDGNCRRQGRDRWTGGSFECQHHDASG